MPGLNISATRTVAAAFSNFTPDSINTLIGYINQSPTLVGELNYAFGRAGGSGVPLQVMTNANGVVGGSFDGSRITVNIPDQAGSPGTVPLSPSTMVQLLGTLAHEAGHVIDDYFNGSLYYPSNGGDNNNPFGVEVLGLQGEVLAYSYEAQVDQEEIVASGGSPATGTSAASGGTIHPNLACTAERNRKVAQDYSKVPCGSRVPERPETAVHNGVG